MFRKYSLSFEGSQSTKIVHTLNRQFLTSVVITLNLVREQERIENICLNSTAACSLLYLTISKKSCNPSVSSSKNIRISWIFQRLTNSMNISSCEIIYLWRSCQRFVRQTGSIDHWKKVWSTVIDLLKKNSTWHRENPSFMIIRKIWFSSMLVEVGYRTGWWKKTKKYYFYMAEFKCSQSWRLSNWIYWNIGIWRKEIFMWPSIVSSRPTNTLFKTFLITIYIFNYNSSRIVQCKDPIDQIELQTLNKQQQKEKKQIELPTQRDFEFSVFCMKANWKRKLKLNR